MAYDLHGNWEEKTGHHTAMFDPDDIMGPTVSESAFNWISLGFPPSKIILGLASYGRTFTLKFPDQNGIGAPAIGNEIINDGQQDAISNLLRMFYSE